MNGIVLWSHNIWQNVSVPTRIVLCHIQPQSFLNCLLRYSIVAHLTLSFIVDENVTPHSWKNWRIIFNVNSSPLSLRLLKGIPITTDCNDSLERFGPARGFTSVVCRLEIVGYNKPAWSDRLIFKAERSRTESTVQANGSAQTILALQWQSILSVSKWFCLHFTVTGMHLLQSGK